MTTSQLIRAARNTLDFLARDWDEKSLTASAAKEQLQRVYADLRRVEANLDAHTSD